MKKDINEIINQLFDSFKLIESSDIPNIDLYMDQITTFINSELSHHKRNDEEKILTKTMINNYAKSSLFPSPEKKKYSKDHMIVLILIYYLKNVMSINDIKTILDPITADFFGNKDGATMTDVYDEICSHLVPFKEYLRNDISEKLSKIDTLEEDADGTSPKIRNKDIDNESLEKFIMVSMLAFDITIKKQVIEKIIDSIEKPEKTDK